MRTRTEWLLHTPSCDYHVFLWRPITDAERPMQYLPRAFLITEWLESPYLEAAVLDMYEAAAGVRLTSAGDRLAREDVAREVEDAFRHHILVCLRIKRVLIHGPSSHKTPPQPPPPLEPAAAVAPTKKKGWIEIELVDQRGKPVAAERYSILLPDGSRADDRLNGSGRAYIDDLDPGNCELSFPDIDAREWEPA